MSGVLIARFGPRGVIASGTANIGVGNILLAGLLALAGAQTHYLAFIIALVFIGAGFMFSTTVRTAIVFASTPLGLSASAAAINEASVALGARIGVVGGTTSVLLGSVATAVRMVEGRPDAASIVAEFRGAIEALGTPRCEEVIAAAMESADPQKGAAYGDGVEIALGVIAAWFLTGRRDPLHTVFEMQEERGEETDAAWASLPPLPTVRRLASGALLRRLGSRRS